MDSYNAKHREELKELQRKLEGAEEERERLREARVSGISILFLLNHPLRCQRFRSRVRRPGLVLSLDLVHWGSASQLPQFASYCEVDIY